MILTIMFTVLLAYLTLKYALPLAFRGYHLVMIPVHKMSGRQFAMFYIVLAAILFTI